MYIVSRRLPGALTLLNLEIPSSLIPCLCLSRAMELLTMVVPYHRTAIKPYRVPFGNSLPFGCLAVEAGTLFWRFLALTGYYEGRSRRSRVVAGVSPRWLNWSDVLVCYEPQPLRAAR
jgi:hypothetical protein